MKNNYKNIDDFLNNVSKESNNFERNINPFFRKKTGSYYTDFEMANSMVSEVINKIVTDNRNIWEMKFLEPCVGTGIFVFSYLKAVKSLSLSKEQYKELINNIYVVDINKDALEIFKKNFYNFVKNFFKLELSKEYFASHVGYSLLFDTTNLNSEYISIDDVFQNLKENSFDIIITNPPYRNLKAEKSFYNTKEDYDKFKMIYSKISILAKHHFIYSTEGSTNLYKYFVEEIVDHYANANAYINILIPSSILSDRSCRHLRTHLLKDYSIQSVKVLPENCPYVDAQQSLCSIFLKSKGKTTDFLMFKDFYNEKHKFTIINISDIISDMTGNAIFAISDQESEILKKLRKFKTIKEIEFIHNFRGELDLTNNKSSLTNIPTKYQLLRGRNIGYYNLHESSLKEYVTSDFVETCKKNNYISNDRIVCQQIANMKKERRISFAYVGKDYVLGNSCNFIFVDENKYKITLYTLLGLLNSSIINWYFKLTSSNNHVNNYEIDNFPIPLNSPQLCLIDALVIEYMRTKEKLILQKIDTLVYKAYGIFRDSEKNANDINNVIVKKYFSDIQKVISTITIDMANDIITGNSSIESTIVQLGVTLNSVDYLSAISITKKYQKLNNDEVLNHITFKMSDLDMEMIKAVPQGGNWKNIPYETVMKSKRLQKITQTGGRTTLYGRIDYKKPSYTITTYFNRPGNGTYIHPTNDRVLSVREAARFQCFKDSYYFYGNKTQLLNQIGNAVPTLFAYQLGKRIYDITGCKRSIDLFCGAGGLTSGFKEAGIKSVLCNDIEESACVTLKTNNPEIEVYQGDITEVSTKEYIVKKAIDQKVEIICGGPPCQGFSLAGYRLDNDPRNKLFKDFLNIVKCVNPKIVVFENVEGLLSFQHGQVYKTIINLFNDIGYKTKGKTIITSEYGIPQKRKRVIIICVRNDLKFDPNELYPKRITINPSSQISAFDAIFDLETIACTENAKYCKTIESKFVKAMKEKITFNEYINSINDELDNTSCADIQLNLFTQKQM